MAEVHLERHKRAIWPWILAAVAVLALLLWFFLLRGPRGAEIDVNPIAAAAPAPPAEPTPGAAGDFQEWVQETTAQEQAGRAPAYTAEGIRHLAEALPELTDRVIVSERPLQEHLDRLRAYADDLERNDTPVTHAGYARSAFLLSTELLSDLDRSEYAQVDTGAEQTRTAAGIIDANVPLTDQIRMVERFFAHASGTIARMANARESAEHVAEAAVRSR